MSVNANLQMPNGGLLHVLTDLIQNIAAGNYVSTFGDCEMGLFTGWPGFSDGIVLGDLTEADYTGYARVAITWGTPYTDAADVPAITSDSHVFRPTDAVTPNTILGAFIVDDVPNLVAIGAFDTSIPLEDANDQAVILATLRFNSVHSYGNYLAED